MKSYLLYLLQYLRYLGRAQQAIISHLTRRPGQRNKESDIAARALGPGL